MIFHSCREFQDISLRRACLDIEYFYIHFYRFSPISHISDYSSNAHSKNSYNLPISFCSRGNEYLDQHTWTRRTRIFIFRAFQIRCSQVQVVYFLRLIVSSPNKSQVLSSTFIMLIFLNHSQDRADRQQFHRSHYENHWYYYTKQNAPDDIHISRRYAALLKAFFSTALRTSQPATPQSNRMDVNSHTRFHQVEILQFDIN